MQNVAYVYTNIHVALFLYGVWEGNEFLLNVISNIYNGLNECKSVSGLFLDITKAFDMVFW